MCEKIKMKSEMKEEMRRILEQWLHEVAPEIENGDAWDEVSGKYYRRLMELIDQFPVATLEQGKEGRGIGMIATERRRQVEEEGWTLEYDMAHDDGDLSLAAVCYATPVKLYRVFQNGRGISFKDPWPFEGHRDKRFSCCDGEDHGNIVPDPSNYTLEERIDLLVKAGALIAAEIDALSGQRKAKEEWEADQRIEFKRKYLQPGDDDSIWGDEEEKKECD